MCCFMHLTTFVVPRRAKKSPVSDRVAVTIAVKVFGAAGAFAKALTCDVTTNCIVLNLDES